LRVDLGRISDEELDLKKVSVETKLDSDVVDEYMASFTDRDNWSDALIRFGVQGPPGGEPDEQADVSGRGGPYREPRDRDQAHPVPSPSEQPAGATVP
jgi:hypothetical protein